MIRVLITGGAGFIGSNIAARLSRNGGYKVVVLDSLFQGATKNLQGLDVEFIQGSVMDQEVVNAASKDVDYVFHEAALSSSPMILKDFKRGLDVNVTGFLNVMEAAVKNNVSKVIFASTSSMYSGNPFPYSEGQEIRPNTPYEASFRCREVVAHAYWKTFNMPSVGLRYFSVYGPRERGKGPYANNISQFIWTMLKGESPIIYGDGSQTRDFTFVEDVVEANILAMKHKDEFEIFNVGTGVGTDFNGLVALLNKTLGTSLPPRYVPNPIGNYVQHTVADISKIRQSLGFEPKWPLEKGVKIVAEYYRDSSNP